MPNDLKTLQRDLQRLKRELVAANNRAVEQTARETVAYAKRLSSGPFKTADLRRAGHPYAKAWGSVQLGLDPSIINKQSGIFQSEWRMERILLANGAVIAVVRNVAPYAKYLETGTHSMFGRPMAVRLEFFAERTWERVAPQIFATALSRTAFAR